MLNVNVLMGKTLSKIREDSAELVFICEDGEKYMMSHIQDCCESVFIEDISGDLQDLVGSPILIAEEVYEDNRGPLNGYDESYTWTFYKFATVKGYVTVRWYGSSNGYYSESVNFDRIS